MNFTYVLIVATLVLFSPLGYANPHTYAPLDDSKIDEETPEADKIEVNDLSVTILKKNKLSDKNKTVEFYPYLESISPKFGFLLNLKESEFKLLLGVSYMFPRYKSPQIEVGADMISDSTGFFRGDFRQIYSPRSYFRPYYKYGLAINVDGDSGLGSIVTLNRYYAHVAAGIEDYLKDPASIRVETELFLSMEKLFWGTVISYSWAW